MHIYSHVDPSCQPGSAWPPAQLLCPVMEKEKKRKEKKEKKKEKRWRISRAASSNTVLAQNLRPRHRPAVTAPSGKLQPLAERPKKLQPAAVLAPRAQQQPLAERPEEAAATGLTHEAKLQPLAEMPEKLQPAATLSAARARPEEAAATLLSHEAKLQPSADMMPEKLRQQQHWARANAHRHRLDQEAT